MDSIKVAKVEGVMLEKGQKRTEGVLHLTPHHLIFTLASGDEDWTPLPHITVLHRLPLSHSGISPIYIRTRMFESLTLYFRREKDAEDVWCSVKDLCLVSSMDQLYAFEYRLPTPSTTSETIEAPQPGTSTHPIDSTTTSVPNPNIFSPLSSLPEPATNSPPTASASGSGTSTPNGRKGESKQCSPGWEVYSPREEFTRMGVGSRNKGWRFTDINKDYVISPTYPAKMVVPSKISDTVLAYACKYRSKARIPALTYLHWANHASITRCSQPLVGLKNNRSAQDERLVEAIFSSHVSPDTPYAPPAVSEYGGGYGGRNPLIGSPSLGAQQLSSSPSGNSAQGQQIYGATSTNLIVDARPTANAMANVAAGAGTENMEYYKMARKAYLGIENIHVMRDSLNKVETALRKAETTGMLDRHLLRRSNWLKHISAILDGALIIIRNVHINSSHVMIHCSDGWDRTTQLSALAQICLDPYFRTIKGFQVLIEKDWVSFGHKFLDRCGHLSPDKVDLTSAPKPEEAEEERNEAAKAAQAFFGAVQKQFTSSSHHVKETSPVFHQFLDCIRQIQRQFPNRFEYNGKFLEDLYFHLYSCQFGTFLANTEKARRTKGGIDDDGASLLVASKPPICDRSLSIWDWTDQAEKLDGYRNPEYDTSLDDQKRSDHDADMGVLLPNAKDVKFWYELYKRGDEEMNGAKFMLAEQAQGVDVLGPIAQSEGDPGVITDPAVAKDALQAVIREGGEGVAAGRDMSGSRARQASWNVGERPASPAMRTTGDSWHNIEATGIPQPDPPKHRSDSPANRYSGGYTSSSSRGMKTGGSGWGWSQISSGALNALQGAAKEIKSISTDAYSSLTAPPREQDANNAGEMWDKPSNRRRFDQAIGTQSASGSRAPGSWSNGYEPRVNRVASEANPWALPESPAAASQPNPLQSSQSSAPPSPNIHDLAPAGLPSTNASKQYPSSSGVSYMADSADLWGSVADRKRAQHPSVAGDAARPSDLGQRMATLSTAETLKPASAEPPATSEVAKSSSWDPLGVA